MYKDISINKYVNYTYTLKLYSTVVIKHNILLHDYLFTLVFLCVKRAHLDIFYFKHL